MGHYKANSTNSRDFDLTAGDEKIGQLKYAQWYSFKSEISMADNSSYQFEPKGFWDSKIELKKGKEKLLDFEMGWKGILINISDSKQQYLLKLKGLLSSTFVLVDTNQKELMAIETDFKWTKFTLDFNIETSNEFDNFDNKEIILLTALHCVNYYMAYINSVI
jgi:hypothetical protein